MMQPGRAQPLPRFARVLGGIRLFRKRVWGWVWETLQKRVKEPRRGRQYAGVAL